MPVLTAEGQLRTMVQASSDPTLSDDEVASLLEISLVRDDGDLYDNAARSTAYTVDALVVPVTHNGFYYSADVAGTTGATEPDWPIEIGATVADGTVTWRNAGLAPIIYNLNKGAAEGWRWKAGKTADRYTFGSDSRQLARSDFHKHCEQMARIYAKRLKATIPVGGPITVGGRIIGNINV